ncbi:MAG: hypothetical protein WD185_01170 [Sneathiella sp.]
MHWGLAGAPDNHWFGNKSDLQMEIMEPAAEAYRREYLIAVVFKYLLYIIPAKD